MKFTYSLNRKPQLGDIPENTTHLYFNHNFDFIIDPYIIPDSVIYIDMGLKYNQKFLPNTLPKNLIELNLSYFYNKIIDKNILPENIKKLSLPKQYNHNIHHNNFPKSLFALCVSSSHLFKIHLPKSINYLKLLNNRPYVGQNVKILEVRFLNNNFNNHSPMLQKIIYRFRDKKKKLKLPYGCIIESACNY